jgi:hypothetical protein
MDYSTNNCTVGNLVVFKKRKIDKLRNDETHINLYYPFRIRNCRDSDKNLGQKGEPCSMCGKTPDQFEDCNEPEHS